MVRIVRRDCEPDVVDQSRSCVVQESQGLAGRDQPIVCIGAAAVIAGGAFLYVVFGMRQIGKPGVRVLRGSGGNERCQQHQEQQSPHGASLAKPHSTPRVRKAC